MDFLFTGAVNWYRDLCLQVCIKAEKDGTSLSLLFPLSFPGYSLQCPHSFLFPFFLGRQRDLNQRSSLALAFLSVYHTTRPRRFVEIYQDIFLHVQVQIYITIQLKHEVMYIIQALLVTYPRKNASMQAIKSTHTSETLFPCMYFSRLWPWHTK